MNYQYMSIKTFFQKIGFQEEEGYMHLMGEASNIHETLKELSKFIKENNIAQSTFDPYKGSISSISGNSEEMMKKVTAKTVNFTDSYNIEINRRHKIIYNTKVERNPQVLLVTQNIAMSQLFNQLPNDEEELISKTQDDEIIRKDALLLIAQNHNDKFTLKARTKYEQLINSPIYIKSEIRIKFPNEHILIGMFALYETVGDIYNFVRYYLAEKNDQFVLSQTPPPVKYTDYNKRIEELRLFPNCILYANFSGDYHGLSGPLIIDITKKV